MAILTDVTRCIGCEECVAGLPEDERHGARRARTAGRRAPPTSPRRAGPRSRAAPGAATSASSAGTASSRPAPSACPVGALKKTPEGPVVYDADDLHGLPLLHDGLPVPHDALRVGVGQPARAQVHPVLRQDHVRRAAASRPAPRPVPTEATIFGEREELLAEAHRRIAERPGPLHRPRLGRARGRRHLGPLHLRRRPEHGRLARRAGSRTPGPSWPARCCTRCRGPSSGWPWPCSASTGSPAGARKWPRPRLRSPRSRRPATTPGARRERRSEQRQQHPRRRDQGRPLAAGRRGHRRGRGALLARPGRARPRSPT